MHIDICYFFVIMTKNKERTDFNEDILFISGTGSSVSRNGY